MPTPLVGLLILPDGAAETMTHRPAMLTLLVPRIVNEKNS